MIRAVFFLSLQLSICMGIVFFAHLGIGYNFKYNPLLFQSYLINVLLVLSSYSLLWIFKNKLNLIITYSLTILFKGSVYFIFFYPIFYEDSILYKKEFMIFFIPYFAGLVIEIFSFKKIYQVLKIN